MTVRNAAARAFAKITGGVDVKELKGLSWENVPPYGPNWLNMLVVEKVFP